MSLLHVEVVFAITMNVFFSILKPYVHVHMCVCVSVGVCFYNLNQDQHCMNELVTSGKNLFSQYSC